MSKKVKKSFQAILATIIIGLLLPVFVKITGVSLLDKTISKVINTILFWIPTVLVGKLYHWGIIKGKVQGGVLRTTIYILLAISVMIAGSATLRLFIKETVKLILSIVVCIVCFLTIFSIIKLVDWIKGDGKKVDPQASQQVPVLVSNKKKQEAKAEQKMGAFEYSSPEQSNNNATIHKITAQCTTRRLKTLYELWSEKDDSTHCLTVTNNENPNLKWVKVYKEPYGDGKFYGYIKMNNAHDTVNGEIYFADRPIWYIVND